MQGWHHTDSGWIRTTDVTAIKATMTALSNAFRNIDEQLHDDMSEDDFEAVITRHNQFAEYWNQNLAFLRRERIRTQIRAVKAEIQTISWPPEETDEDVSSR